MQNVLNLSLACLLWLGSWSAGTRAADIVDTKGGGIGPGCYVNVQGKLLALPTPAWLGEKGLSWVIQVNWQQIYVGFGGDEKLRQALAKVGDKLVGLEGTLEFIEIPPDEGRGAKKVPVVQVKKLEEVTKPEAKDWIGITLVGTLQLDPAVGTSDPPHVSGTFAVGEAKYPVVFARNEKLLEKADALNGKLVLAAVDLDRGVLVVKTLSENR
jgi:hypothetical protein